MHFFLGALRVKPQTKFSWAKSLNFGLECLHVYILPYYVYLNSEGSGESMHLHNLIEPSLINNAISTEISSRHRCEKTCLRGFRQSDIQLDVLSYRD